MASQMKVKWGTAMVNENGSRECSTKWNWMYEYKVKVKVGRIPCTVYVRWK